MRVRPWRGETSFQKKFLPSKPPHFKKLPKAPVPSRNRSFGKFFLWGCFLRARSLPSPTASLHFCRVKFSFFLKTSLQICLTVV